MAKLNVWSLRPAEARTPQRIELSVGGETLVFWAVRYVGDVFREALRVGEARRLVLRHLGYELGSPDVPVQEPLPLPAVDGVVVPVSEPFFVELASVLAAQAAPSDEDRYTAEELVILAARQPAAYDALVEQIAALNAVEDVSPHPTQASTPPT